MFELEGFGARLQKLRKEKGMTQEELAGRVNVTGQAVSKWENGQAYPDITLIPTLVTILGTEIDYLFGKKVVQRVNSFPSTHAGLPMVHSTEYAACYSDKEVTAIDQTGVKFADGSTAELTNRLAVNMGQGDILFLAEADAPEDWHGPDPGLIKKEVEFGYTQNIEMTLNQYDCQITASQDEMTRVRASGEARFINNLEVMVSGDTLILDQEPMDNYNSRGHKNTVIIEMPCEIGNRLEVKINGSAKVLSEIKHFDTGLLVINGSGVIGVQDFIACVATVNGSGDIEGNSADELTLTVNGSGDVNWNTVNKAKASVNGSGDIEIGAAKSLSLAINGSGDVKIDKMTGGGDCITKIAGSGDIVIESGSCEKFDADIHGSGDIDATGLTAREASIVLHQDGTVTLGRVLERSSEQIKKKGRIKILNRGQ